MKVTHFSRAGLPLALSGWSTGFTSVNSNFNTVDGGLNALNFVQGITAEGSNMLLRPIANIAAGSNILLTLDSGPGGSIPSNTIRIHSTASGGGNIITANGSNSLAAVVNLKAGTGIALGVSGQDITITNTGVPGPAGSGGGGGSTGARYPIRIAGSGSASGTTRTATFGTAPTNGNTLIAVTLSEGSGSVSSIVTTNVTWSLLAQSTAAVAPVIEIWKGVVSASAGTGNVVTWSDNTFHNVDVIEWSGLTGTLDQNAQLHGTDGANHIAIITPTAQTALVVTGISTLSNSTPFSTFIGTPLVLAASGTSLGAYYGFPGATTVYGIAIGGNSNTYSSCTISIT